MNILNTDLIGSTARSHKNLKKLQTGFVIVALSLHKHVNDLHTVGYPARSPSFLLKKAISNN